jgi:hypothetical protein
VVEVKFRFDELSKKWIVIITGVSDETEAKQAFNAVTKTILIAEVDIGLRHSVSELDEVGSYSLIPASTLGVPKQPKKPRKYAPHVKENGKWRRVNPTGYRAFEKNYAASYYQDWLLAPFLGGVNEVRELRPVEENGLTGSSDENV